MDLIEKYKNKYLNKTMNWNFIIVLSIIILLFGYNDYLSIASIILVAIVVVRLDIEELLLSYIYLYFFEEVMCLSNIYGLTIVFISPIIAIKLIHYIIKNKIYPNKREIIIFAFFMVSSIISIITNKFMKATLVLDMNVTIILMFSMIIRKLYSDEKIKNLIEKICLTIIIACINSILYGILHNNFLNERRGDKITIRYKGAYEPNYTALYLNLGIISIIYLWNKLGKKMSIILLTICIIALLFTKSTTGLICFIIILFLLSIKNMNIIKENMRRICYNKNKKYIITVFFIILILLFIIELRYKLFTDKLLIVFNKIKSGDLNSATSGRIPIIKSFIENFKSENIFNKLFGNAPQALKTYSNYFKTDKYSHNTYVDFIYSFGIVGCIMALTYIYTYTKKHILFNRSMDGKYKDLILYYRIILLISGIGLALHCEIIFLVLYLI